MYRRYYSILRQSRSRLVFGCVVLVLCIAFFAYAVKALQLPNLVVGILQPAKVQQAQFVKDVGATFVSYGQTDNRLVSHTFEVTNSSAQTWHPRLVGSSCGCLRVDFEPDNVSPHDTLTVQMSFRPGYVRQSQTERAVIATGSGHLTFELSASVFPIIWPEDIGRELKCELDSESVSSRKVLVSTYLPLRDEDQRMKLSCETDGSFSVKIRPIDRQRIEDLAVHVKYEAEVAFTGEPVPRGETVTDSLRWKLGDAEFDTAIKVCRPAVIAARPESIFVNGTDATIQFEVVLSGTRAFSVTAVESSSTMLCVELRESTPTRKALAQSLHLTLSTGETKDGSDARSCFLLVKTDDARQRVVRVPVWILE